MLAKLQRSDHKLCQAYIVQVLSWIYQLEDKCLNPILASKLASLAHSELSNEIQDTKISRWIRGISSYTPKTIKGILNVIYDTTKVLSMVNITIRKLV